MTDDEAEEGLRQALADRLVQDYGYTGEVPDTLEETYDLFGRTIAMAVARDVFAEASSVRLWLR